MEKAGRNGKRMTATRRGFLQAASAASVFWIPATRLFGQTLPPVSKQVRFAIIGAGGIGYGTRGALCDEGGTCVALCDTDEVALAEQLKDCPGVPTFVDYREMLDKAGKEFDAVAVATPDHTHAWLTIECLLRGKHVYCQKPLAHSVEECELVREVQRKTGLVLQMGNQGHPGTKRYAKLLQADAWGRITEIHGWSTTRRVATLGERDYPKTIPWNASYPRATNWDLWCGPAPDHGYSRDFAPYIWRDWWDYGSGLLGDMGVHTLDPLFDVFEIGLPVSVTAEVAPPVTIAYQKQSRIVMRFAPGKRFPEGVSLIWHEGGLKPSKVKGSHPKLEYERHGLLVCGEKMTTLAGSHAAPPIVVAESGHDWNDSSKALQTKYAKLARYDFPGGLHYREFIDAARAGDPEKCGSKPSYSAPLTEAMQVANIALRFPGRELAFDWERLRFGNCPEANAFLRAPSRGDWDFRKLVPDVRTRFSV